MTGISGKLSVQILLLVLLIYETVQAKPILPIAIEYVHAYNILTTDKEALGQVNLMVTEDLALSDFLKVHIDLANLDGSQV